MHESWLRFHLLGQKFNAFNFAKDMPLLLNEVFIFQMSVVMIEATMTNDEVQKLMRTESFDAVIVELFGLDALMGFGQHFNCPVLGVTTFDGVYWNDLYTANQSPYSYVPMIFAGLPDEMTFVQRLQNTVLSVAEKILIHFYHLPKQRKLYEKFFPDAKFSFDEIHKNISVVFMNSHVSSSAARPFMPNMVGIGGIHVEPSKPLPQDIQEFLDSATDGAILFSMGSFVQSTDWTVQQREAFVNVFGKLKQKILWKYENETLPCNPGNIKIGKWLPQRDIVAHPNVKLFITHGGQCGTTEALYEGVPLLGFPLFGDQGMNIERAVQKGYALSLEIESINEENFGNALNELLTNPKYKMNAERFASISKDRLVNPKDSVVYYTEHVIRHQGADYLKSVGRNLNFIEFHLIDVYVTLIGGILVAMFVFSKTLKLVFSRKIKKSEILSKKKKK
jgi:glucuronosyltransferase